MGVTSVLERMQRWLGARRWKLEARQRKKVAIRRACEAFEKSRGIVPMNGYVIHAGEGRTIVRIMYSSDRIPPDRTWFAVPDDGSSARELDADEALKFDKALWR
jgi:hypothetical protein